jgi:hypothetical protein
MGTQMQSMVPLLLLLRPLLRPLPLPLLLLLLLLPLWEVSSLH